MTPLVKWITVRVCVCGKRGGEGEVSEETGADTGRTAEGGQTQAITHTQSEGPSQETLTPCVTPQRAERRWRGPSQVT